MACLQHEVFGPGVDNGDAVLVFGVAQIAGDDRSMGVANVGQVSQMLAKLRDRVQVLGDDSAPEGAWSANAAFDP